MRGLDFVGAGEVGDGAGDLEDAVVGARGKRKPFHRLLQQVAEGRIERAVFAEVGLRHAGIAGNLRAGKARVLAVAGGLDAGAQGGRGFTGFFRTQFGQREGGCLDMQVDAVEQRAADACAVTLDLHGRAAAGVPGVAEVAARAVSVGAESRQPGINRARSSRRKQAKGHTKR